MNRKLLTALAAAGCVIAPAAFAQTFQDNARVVSVRAVNERIPVAREECWNDRVRGYENRTVTRSDTGAAIGPGTVLGAVVGGVIGHQFGSSSGGHDRGTAAGAIVGGLVGNQVDRSNGAPPVETREVERVPVERNVERCRTVQEVREAVVGYDVSYEYRGRQFTTRMPYDPGRMVPVRVDVAPVVDAPPAPRAPRHPAYH
ncbi:MAG TPA: glycine zipper 2TM domain-containing protein [Usitatibacter sp.]|jgi:uncharacterized protein YcfJ|nr:glycine zipper 2TM domain-containing protein [Usitatibacter sp.]